MGHVESKHHVYLCYIKLLLKQGGGLVPMENIVTLVRAVEEYCPWFPEKGTLDVEIWDCVDATFWELVSTGNYVPVTVWGDWALVHAVLMTCQSRDPLQLPQFSESDDPPPLPQPSSPAQPSLSDQPLPSSTPPPPDDVENSVSNSGDFGLQSPPTIFSFHEELVLVAPAPRLTQPRTIYMLILLFSNLWSHLMALGPNYNLPIILQALPCPLQPLTLLSFWYLNRSLCHPLSLLPVPFFTHERQ